MMEAVGAFHGVLAAARIGTPSTPSQDGQGVLGSGNIGGLPWVPALMFLTKRKPPFWAVSRPARPHKSAIYKNDFVGEMLKALKCPNNS